MKHCLRMIEDMHDDQEIQHTCLAGGACASGLTGGSSDTCWEAGAHGHPI